MIRLALLPLIALAACTPHRAPTEAMLQERGLAFATVSAEPWLFGPCDWSEPYTAHFAGRLNGEMIDGIVCSTNEHASDARLVAVRKSSRGRS